MGHRKYVGSRILRPGRFSHEDAAGFLQSSRGSELPPIRCLWMAAATTLAIFGGDCTRRCVSHNVACSHPAPSVSREQDALASSRRPHFSHQGSQCSMRMGNLQTCVNGDGRHTLGPFVGVLFPLLDTCVSGQQGGPMGTGLAGVHADQAFQPLCRSRNGNPCP